MNLHVSTDIFSRESTCAYKGETYLVRDNGAILRRAREGKRLRPLDESWTFGTPCKSTGYMNIASEKVHRIVATAFHGEAPSKGHVVDHKDTNRRNNRPGNLRWVTRLENVLLNPITAKRIAWLYGSIEAFLEDPRNPVNGAVTPDFEWMRAVTPEESKRTLERMTAWAAAEQATKSSTSRVAGTRNRGLGDWIFQRGAVDPDPALIPDPPKPAPPDPLEGLVSSLTGGAWQRSWRVKAAFPLCTKPSAPDTLAAYADRLVLGAVVVESPWGETAVDQVAIAMDRSEIIVLGYHGEEAIKSWSVMRITLENIEGRKIIHESKGMFFTREGAEQAFTELQGLEWKGEDSVDNYC